MNNNCRVAIRLVDARVPCILSALSVCFIFSLLFFTDEQSYAAASIDVRSSAALNHLKYESHRAVDNMYKGMGIVSSSHYL